MRRDYFRDNWIFFLFVFIFLIFLGNSKRKVSLVIKLIGILELFRFIKCFRFGVSEVSD